MRTVWILLVVALVGLGSTSFAADVKDGKVPARLLADAGKTFTGPRDPQFVSYDLALRDYLVKRINKEFGVTLDAKSYSGFDLLDIEACLKCKKSNEPVELYLKAFKKSP
jgi:hypothetical protein